jgi:hypothetical protein
MKGKKNANNILVRKSEVDNLEDLGVDGKRNGS